MSYENLQLTGILVILAGFLILIVSIFLQGKNSKAESGGFMMLGPIPVAFGSMNNPSSLKYPQILGIAIVFIYVIWLFYLKK